MTLYSPASNEPLFQYKVNSVWMVLTETRIRKCLSKINVKIGLPKSYFTFHAFRSGATLAYKSQVPVQSIKDHGLWASAYIHKDHTAGEDIASFAKFL